MTIQQPWAWAIIHGAKDVENRTQLGMWRAAVGQRIAVHAGARLSERGMNSPTVVDAWAHAHPFVPFDLDLLDYSAIIGTVHVTEIHPEQGGCCQPWGETSYTETGGQRRVDIVHLVLADPVPCDPIPVRGKLGLWHVPADVEAALRSRKAA